MKDKLSELESQGITPTREHVLDNLQLIKDISKGLYNKEFNFEIRLQKKHFESIYIKLQSLSFCLFVCPIITQEPLD